MKKQIKKLWVAALRSGEYEKTTGKLRYGNSFCCLGVLCNLHAQAHPEIAAKEMSSSIYLSERAVLPWAVVNWAGLNDRHPSVEHKGAAKGLAVLNDKGMSFKQIANLIEKSL